MYNSLPEIMNNGDAGIFHVYYSLNVETTTTNNVFRSAGGGDGVGWKDAHGSVSDG